MTAEILGLAPSVTAYKPSGNITIGVNDIFKICSVDHLIVIDNPNQFNNKRKNTILQSTPKLFISQINTWNRMKNFHLIKLANVRGSVSQIEQHNIYPYSIMSPYVAIVHAYKLGATEIIIYGVDLLNHKSLTGDSKIKRVLTDISTLNQYLIKKNVSLKVYNKSSRLSSILDHINSSL